MCTPDASMPVKGISNETYMYQCGICQSGDCDERSWQYCYQCREYLCIVCRNDHSILGDLRNHKVISGPMHLYQPDIKQSSVSALMMFNKVLNLKISSSSKVNIKLPSDEWTPLVTGCTFLSSGELCDSWNNKLKRLDSSLVVQESLHMDGLFDVSTSDDVDIFLTASVIVSLPSKKTLQYVHLKPKLMSTGCTIILDKRCFGVKVVGKFIYVSCHDEPGTFMGDIRLLDLYGNEKKRFDATVDNSPLFDKPLYVTGTSDNNFIYISDNRTNTVVCLNLNGDVMYWYNQCNDRLKKARGMYVDTKGNVLVCSHANHSVQVVTAAGTHHKTLLSYKDTGLIKPMCVSFRPYDGILIVGCESQNELSVFRVCLE